MSFQFGDVVLVPFPFTDQSATKQRPGVVISNAAYHQARRDLILMPISGHIRQSSAFGDVSIHDWQSAKLLKPSVVKPVIAALEQSLIIKTLGKLSQRDQVALKEAIVPIIA